MLDISILNEVKTLIGDGLTCPADIEGLNKIIELKNKLTKQLNNLNGKIEQINKIIAPLSKTIDTSEKAIPPLDAVIQATQFIPSTSVTPIPVGPILQAKQGIDLLKYLIGESRGKVKTAESFLLMLTSKVQMVIDLLSMVDMFINMCAEELGEDTITQERISDELLKSTQEQSKQGSPIVTNFNGFEMSVVTVDELTGSNLKRRQAVAQNWGSLFRLFLS